jgi:hypothetical protein
VNTPTVDASQDVVSHSRGIPIPIADVPDNTHLLPPTGVAEGASPSTALPSDPFSKSIHSDVSSITSRDTESVLDPDRRRMDGTGTAGDEILPSSKPRMDDILRGTDSTCEQAKGPISSQISLPRPSILRSLSDEINIYFSMVAQSDSNGNEGARGKCFIVFALMRLPLIDIHAVSTRSSTKSSESSESSESNKSDSSNAEESPAGSGIFRPIASIKSFSEDEMTRNWAVRLKQDDELDRRIAEAASPLSAEPDPINPRLEPILRRVTQLGLDSESTQVLA